MESKRRRKAFRKIFSFFLLIKRCKRSKPDFRRWLLTTEDETMYGADGIWDMLRRIIIEFATDELWHYTPDLCWCDNRLDKAQFRNIPINLFYIFRACLELYFVFAFDDCFRKTYLDKLQNGTSKCAVARNESQPASFMITCDMMTWSGATLELIDDKRLNANGSLTISGKLKLPALLDKPYISVAMVGLMRYIA